MTYLHYDFRHAVRRFVYENHGLMKRMYGEQRHFSVLRAEIDSNDLDQIHNGWHDSFHEPTFKKYDKLTPTILRQTFHSAGTHSANPFTNSTTTSTTAINNTTISTTSLTTTTTKTTTPDDNITMADMPFSTENDELTTTDSFLDTTVAEELPLSTSTTTQSTTSLPTSKGSQLQFFQETTSKTSSFRVKGM